MVAVHFQMVPAMLTGQPASATGVYLTGCDKVIYGGIKTELAHTISSQVNVAFNSQGSNKTSRQRIKWEVLM